MTAARVGSLFSGYGGLDLGLARVLDVETAWVADVCRVDSKGVAGHHDPCRSPCTILAHRFPDAANLGDVTKVDWSSVEPVDIITGGSPCQDLSHAGKRAGMTAGTRSGLWASMCDAIETIRPRLVLWENVRGALSAPASAGDMESCEFCVGGDGEPPLRALGRVLGDLAELGYDAAWTGLRAADVGAPHGRWRVFVLAWPEGDAGLTWPEGDAGLTWPEGDAAALLPTPAVNDMGRAYTPEEWDAWTERMRAALEGAVA